MIDDGTLLVINTVVLFPVQFHPAFIVAKIVGVVGKQVNFFIAVVQRNTVIVLGKNSNAKRRSNASVQPITFIFLQPYIDDSTGAGCIVARRRIFYQFDGFYICALQAPQQIGQVFSR